jgi:hypothetical protein
VTVRESEFSAEDVAALIASRRAASQRRGPHGYTLAEAMDPTVQGRVSTSVKRDWILAKLNADQKLYYDRYPQAKGDSSFVWDVRVDD